MRNRMRLNPQGAGRSERIDCGLPPPLGFITMTMELAMMAPTERNGELITDLAPERPALRKAQVMSVRWLTAANQAWLMSDKSNVVAVTYPARLRQ